MVKNVIGLSIIFLGALIVGAYYNHVTPFWTGDKTKQLEVIWQQDMETLIKNKKLPNEWHLIVGPNDNAQCTFAKILKLKQHTWNKVKV